MIAERFACKPGQSNSNLPTRKEIPMQKNNISESVLLAPSRSIARKLATRIIGSSNLSAPACDTGCGCGSDGALDDCSLR
jgi:hypothetical protein